MGIRFDGNNQFLKNTNVTSATLPFNAYPWSMGFWAFPRTANGNEDMVAISNSGNQYWELQRGGADLSLFTSDGTTENSISLSSVLTANAWHYILIRAISASNRRADILRPSGGITSGQDTNSRTPNPSTLDSFCIGAFNDSPVVPFTGDIAEFWYAPVDIQPGGAATLGTLMRQLAYGGPLSLSYITENLFEYRSFREGVYDDAVLWGIKGQQRWTHPNGYSIGLHPPLPYEYKNVDDHSRLVMI